ncbi:MAG: NifU family protein [Candidatus Kapaibacteriota bacterium]|jgi:Fe-S cluster biogenesis protein NfuA
MTRDSVIEHIESILIQIRPSLQKDGGDIEFVRYEDEIGVVEVRFLGQCAQCPMQMMTLRAGVERWLLAGIPSLKRIELVR